VARTYGRFLYTIAYRLTGDPDDAQDLVQYGSWPHNPVELLDCDIETLEGLFRRELVQVLYEGDAQDLVQETLLRVRKGLRTYRPGSMEGWLSRIVTNAFLDDVRRRRRRPVASLGDAPEGVFGSVPAADEAMMADALPSDIQQALLRVPEEFRVAVVLSDVVGLSYQQISEALGTPLGTVRSRIHRGRALLREALS